MNPLTRLQAEWDACATNDNTPDCDRPTLASIIGGAGLIMFALIVWTVFLIVTNGGPQ